MNDAHRLLPLIGTSAAIAVIISAPVSALEVAVPLTPVTNIVKTTTTTILQPPQNILPAPSPPVSAEEPPAAVADEPIIMSTLKSIVPVAPSVVNPPRLPSPPVSTPRQQSAPQPTSQAVSTPTAQAQPRSATVAFQTLNQRGAPATLALQKLSANYSRALGTNNSRQASASDIIFQIAIVGLLAGAGSLYYAIMKRQN